MIEREKERNVGRRIQGRGWAYTGASEGAPSATSLKMTHLGQIAIAVQVPKFGKSIHGAISAPCVFSYEI